MGGGGAEKGKAEKQEAVATVTCAPSTPNTKAGPVALFSDGNADELFRQAFS